MKEKTATLTWVCPPWLSFLLELRFRRFIHNPEKIFRKYLKDGDTAVDLGCGSGYFTIPMARMVGPAGRVIAVDLQEKMLSKVRKKADRAQLTERIVFHQCAPQQIGWQSQADFILAFYMFHETPDPAAFLEEIKKILAEDGKLLIVEPPVHVTKKNFSRLHQLVEASGLNIIGRPYIIGGRTLLASL